MLSPWRWAREVLAVRRLTRAKWIESLTWDEVFDIWRSYSHHRRAREAVEAELDRRDAAEKKREREARKRARALAREQARKEEYYLFTHAQYMQACEETRGNLLNARGRQKGVCEESLFRGGNQRAYAYASEELKNFWMRHPRMSYQEFRRQSRQPLPDEGAAA